MDHDVRTKLGSTVHLLYHYIQQSFLDTLTLTGRRQTQRDVMKNDVTRTKRGGEETGSGVKRLDNIHPVSYTHLRAHETA